MPSAGARPVLASKAVEAGLLERFREDPKARAAMENAVNAVHNGADPFSAAEDVLASI
ncbi:MAG: hypothetical protein IPF95_18415 [Flavobacteriales bacterium]|nr:hypothetical protein [Flavobacteriales bacterium]